MPGNARGELYAREARPMFVLQVPDDKWGEQAAEESVRVNKAAASD